MPKLHDNKRRDPPQQDSKGEILSPPNKAAPPEVSPSEGMAEVRGGLFRICGNASAVLSVLTLMGFVLLLAKAFLPESAFAKRASELRLCCCC